MVLDRRTFLRTGLVVGGVVGGGTVLGTGGPAVAAPSLVRSGRPRLTHGVQSGDVTANGGVVWARSDQPARMLVEVSDRPDFKHARTVKGPLLTADTDFTGKTFLKGLPSDRRIHYRVRLEGDRTSSAPTAGGFRTPPRGRRDLRFVWSGDLAGQGWGINPDLGGYRIFSAMAALDPDFFLCSGDFVYSDGPLTETVALPDGRTWRNLVTPEKAKVAETLAEYRGQFRYNLLDANLRAFNAAVPMVYQWDDHEVLNNWYPGEILDDVRYTEKRVDVLAARARRAAIEYTPTAIRSSNGRIYRKIEHGSLLDVFVVDMRTYKDPNGPNTSTSGPGLLGAEQLAWLKRELRASKATWKVIAADLPIGLVVPDGTAQEGIAQGDGGRPLGREREIADLLSYAKRHRVDNMVWLTTDVHYTAAHYYDPAKAAFSDFDPFWEFVSGPLNAGAFGPNALEGTFGPQLRFAKTPPQANTSPADGHQFFGEVAIDGGSKVLTVRLRDLDGTVLFSTDLDPAH
ncbi:alkaline phosphatase D family protein [Actinomadura sp. HBU206391]|uniref:alkaline phosphatase D family protein n=1 Tax=Actinomadura sp. HBU206391 TaxID=2731692 RepID=UPI001650C5CE|nr:alkaline phosphatase D family protein [Actinomadura sp. HBU206391]MBC6456953.1 alkaline phosphatase D family protein [Actinomadura sp. HBU206391]